MTTQPFDLDLIEVGQHVRFACPKLDCPYAYWHIWLPADAAGKTFGDPHCYLHGSERPLLLITEVKDG